MTRKLISFGFAHTFILPSLFATKNHTLYEYAGIRYGVHLCSVLLFCLQDVLCTN